MPTRWLTNGVDRDGTDHPLLTNGLFDRDVERLRAAQAAYDTEFTQWAGQAVWRGTGVGVAVAAANGEWYPDERGG